MTKQTLKKNLAEVGEEITHELGIKMVNDYQSTFPSDLTGYQVGRNIIDNILAQPGCVGIRFYNAINEVGQKTLVYVGVDRNDNVIAEYVSINASGKMEKAKGIVADRLKPPKDGDTLEIDIDKATWGIPE